MPRPAFSRLLRPGLTALILLCSGRTATAQDPCARAPEALARRDFEQAERQLLQCKSVQPLNPWPYLQLCGVYQQQGRTEDLVRAAEEGMKRFPGESRFYLTVGTHAGRQEQYLRAVEVFAEGLRRWPEDARFRRSLADSHAGLGMMLLDSGKNPEAEPHLRRATELDPEDIEALLNLGRALHNLNRSTEALAAFDRVLRLDPNLPLAHFHRGLVLYGTGEFDAAAAELRREIELNPEYPPSRLFLGLAHMALGAWAEALTPLADAARRMPENAKAQYSYARCLVQLGNAKDAEPALRKTMDLDPADPAPVNTLAGLLLAAGRESEAQEMFGRAAELSRRQRSADPGEIRFEPSPPPRPK